MTLFVLFLSLHRRPTLLRILLLRLVQMDVLEDGEVVIQHLVEVKTGSKRIVDVFRVSSDGQKVKFDLKTFEIE